MDFRGARARNDKTMGLRLAKEFFFKYQTRKAIKNQTLMHKQAYVIVSIQIFKFQFIF